MADSDYMPAIPMGSPAVATTAADGESPTMGPRAPASGRDPRSPVATPERIPGGYAPDRPRQAALRARLERLANELERAPGLAQRAAEGTAAPAGFACGWLGQECKNAAAELRQLLALLAVALVVLAGGCSSSPAHPCHYSMTAPETVNDGVGECVVTPMGYATTLAFNAPGGTWLTIAYAPSAHPPLLSFTAAWATSRWRCSGEAVGSWAVVLDGPGGGRLLAASAQCVDGDPAHAAAITLALDD